MRMLYPVLVYLQAAHRVDLSCLAFASNKPSWKRVHSSLPLRPCLDLLAFAFHDTTLYHSQIASEGLLRQVTQ